MRLTPRILVPILLLAGCKDDKPPAPNSGDSAPAKVTPSGEPNPTPAVPTTAVAGTINGQAFKPDRVILEGNKLEFRTGKRLISESEISFNLPTKEGEKLEGKEWTFDGQFEAPTVVVSTKDHQGTPFVSPSDYTMTVKFTKQTKKSIEGSIDFKLKKSPNTRLAGTFTAEIKKSPKAPLDAEDAPYVAGRIKFVGEGAVQPTTIGFIGKGADGKEYSNSAGMPVGSKEGPGGYVMSGTFAPQLTTIFAEKDGPVYRHVHLKPGDYLVYVSRGGPMVAWKRVAVKAGDELTVDLTIDPSKFGDLIVTLPEEEAKDTSTWPVSLVPLGDVPAITNHFAFSGAETKVGEKVVTIKGVPAGKYRAVRGQSEAEVEVVVGKTTAVTLVRRKE